MNLGPLLGESADVLCTRLMPGTQPAEGEELVRPVLVESAGRLDCFNRTCSFSEHGHQT